MSKSTENRIQELEEKVAKLERKNDYQKYAEADLIEYARQYGRLKCFGSAKNGKGETVLLCQSEVNDTMEHYLNLMKGMAVALIRADAE